MNRPDLHKLSDRRAPALHRTLPTWSRERQADGSVQWRIYAPSRFGGALYAVRTFAADTPRSTVAAALRFHRRIIWGRSADAPSPVAVPAPSAAPSSDVQLDLFGVAA